MEAIKQQTSNMNEKFGQGFHDFKRKSDPSTFHYDFTNYVKSYGDVYFWKQGNFHVVTKALLAKQALMDPKISCDRSSFFLSRMPNMDLSLIQDFFAVVSKMMVMRDGEDHKQRRNIATFGLNDNLIDSYASQIDGILEEFVKNLPKDKEFNFASELSNKLPSIILADLFCIPNEDRDDFYEWSNIMTGFFGGGTGYENEDGIKVNNAALSLKKYFTSLIEQRRKSPKKDFFSGMLEVSEKFKLDDEDLISQAIMMLVAGQVTTTDQMNNIMYQLLIDRKTLSTVASDNSQIPKMIEEFKRLDPAVTFIFRVAIEDTMIGEQIIRAGDTVFISTHCLNRDPMFFEHPHEVNLSRPANHFSYGYGPHYCLGARLGRIEMKKLFTYLIKHFPNMRLGQTEIERDHYSLSFSGFNKLPVVLS